MRRTDLYKTNIKVARNRWGFERGHIALQALKMYSEEYRFCLSTGDLLFLNQNWYVTHAGLLRLALRKHCRGIEVSPVAELCNSGLSRYAFKAAVYTSTVCKGLLATAMPIPPMCPP